jgi:hypothetical protein
MSEEEQIAQNLSEISGWSYENVLRILEIQSVLAWSDPRIPELVDDLTLMMDLSNGDEEWEFVVSPKEIIARTQHGDTVDLRPLRKMLETKP